MDPQLSGFALGLLLGAAKVMGIAAVGFGIAWWRARARIRKLEAEQFQPVWTEERLARLEQGLDYAASQLDQVVRTQVELTQLLSGSAGESRARLRASSADRPIEGEPRS